MVKWYQCWDKNSRYNFLIIHIYTILNCKINCVIFAPKCHCLMWYVVLLNGQFCGWPPISEKVNNGHMRKYLVMTSLYSIIWSFDDSDTQILNMSFVLEFWKNWILVFFAIRIWTNFASFKEFSSLNFEKFIGAY